MNVSSQDKAKERDEWIERLMAEKQRQADEAGVPLLVYMANEHGGILKPVIIKLLKHAKAHPGECPDDCEFQASIERLKIKYRVSQ